MLCFAISEGDVGIIRRGISKLGGDLDSVQGSMLSFEIGKARQLEG